MKALVVLAFVALSGCAASEGGLSEHAALSSLGSGECFRGADVDNFNVKDQQVLYVSTRQGYTYRLDTTEDCFARGAQTVVVGPFLSSTPQVCTGGQATVSSAQSREAPTRCIARVSGPIADSRESGLPSRRS